MRRRIVARLRAVAAAGIAAAGCEAPPAAAPAPVAKAGVPAAVSKRVEAAFEAGDVGALDLAAWQDGVLRFATRRGLDADEPLPLASLTKTITAALVLDLVRRGVVGIDDPVEQWVPEAAHLAPGARIGDLLAHRGGVIADWLAGLWAPSPPDWHAVFEETRREGPAAPPGDRTLYSNLGYTILGAVVERATGRSFEAAVEDFATLRFGGRIGTHGPDGLVEPRVRLVPAGGAYGRARDLGPLLAEAAAGARRGGPRPCAPFETAPAVDLDRTWGLGWGLRRAELPGARRLCWHAGRTPGHGAFALVLPEEDVAVVVLARGPRAAEVARGIAVEAAGALAPTAISALARPVPHEVSPPHPGRYVTEAGLVEVSASEGGLRVRFGAREGTLRPDGTGRYRLEPSARPARFWFWSVGTVHLLVAGEAGVAEPVGVAVGPLPPVPAPLRARAGCYGVHDPVLGRVGAARLDAFDDHLRLRLAADAGVAIDGTFVLVAEGDGRARVLGVGRSAGARLHADGAGLFFLGWSLRRDDAGGCRDLVDAASEGL